MLLIYRCSQCWLCFEVGFTHGAFSQNWMEHLVCLGCGTLNAIDRDSDDDRPPMFLSRPEPVFSCEKLFAAKIGDFEFGLTQCRGTLAFNQDPERTIRVELSEDVRCSFCGSGEFWKAWRKKGAPCPLCGKRITRPIGRANT